MFESKILLFTHVYHSIDSAVWYMQVYQNKT